MKKQIPNEYWSKVKEFECSRCEYKRESDERQEIWYWEYYVDTCPRCNMITTDK